MRNGSGEKTVLGEKECSADWERLEGRECSGGCSGERGQWPSVQRPMSSVYLCWP